MRPWPSAIVRALMKSTTSRIAPTRGVEGLAEDEDGWYCCCVLSLELCCCCCSAVESTNPESLLTSCDSSKNPSSSAQRTHRATEETEKEHHMAEWLGMRSRVQMDGHVRCAVVFVPKKLTWSTPAVNRYSFTPCPYKPVSSPLSHSHVLDSPRQNQSFGLHQKKQQAHSSVLMLSTTIVDAPAPAPAAAVAARPAAPRGRMSCDAIALRTHPPLLAWVSQ